MDRIVREILLQEFRLSFMECVSIKACEMDANKASGFHEEGFTQASIVEKSKTSALCSLVFTSCRECVTKSRMMGDYQVRFCEQLRDEISLG